MEFVIITLPALSCQRTLKLKGVDRKDGQDETGMKNKEASSPTKIHEHTVRIAA